MNIFNLHGPEFLKIYAILLVAGVAMACWARWKLRGTTAKVSPRDLELNAYETAYLRGGPRAAVDAAVTSLVYSKELTADPLSRRIRTSGILPDGATPLEDAVHTCTADVPSGRTIEKIRSECVSATARMRTSLEDRGLVLDTTAALIARVVPGFLVLSVLGIGMIKVGVGISRDKPVGFLVLMCVLTFVIATLFFAIGPLRTRLGDRALKQIRDKNETLRYTATHSEASLSGADVALAMGLFGTAVLGMGPLEDLKDAMRQPNTKSSHGCGAGCGGGGGSSCGGGGSSCGGGGGCGGGGCGGCGGG